MRKLYIKKSQDVFFDEIFAFLFAISPILNNYRGLVVSAGITLLIIIFPYEIYKLLRRRTISVRSIRLLMPLLLFWTFKVIDHGSDVTEIGQVIIYIVLFMTLAEGRVQPEKMIRCAVIVSCVASACIIVQTISYYLLDNHIQFVPTSLLKTGSEQWIKLAQTGRISVNGRMMRFYRPSAFFLEPSHMFTYMCFPLFYKLLSPKIEKKDLYISIIISVGMILSTSGMGIVATAAVWFVFLGGAGNENRHFNIKNYFRPRNVMIIFAFMLAAIFMFYKVEFFNNSIARIFSSSTNYNNAVLGRISSGTKIIQSLRGEQLWLGVADHYSDVSAHMSGFNATMYKYGILGTLLSYLFYLRALFFLKDQFFWMAILIIVYSFFAAHSHGTIYMMYFITFFLEGYLIKKNKKVLFTTV